MFFIPSRKQASVIHTVTYAVRTVCFLGLSEKIGSQSTTVHDDLASQASGNIAVPTYFKIQG